MPSQSKSNSVFHALGSYADRIKDQQSSSSTPNGSAHQTASSSTSTKGNSKAESTDDDGAWETVRVGRNKARERPEEKKGSNSRNWREREDKPEPKEKEKEKKEPEDDRKKRKEEKRSEKPKSAWGVASPSAPTPESDVANGTEPEKESWRRPQPSEEASPAPVARQAAPPPGVNPWDLRKKQLPVKEGPSTDPEPEVKPKKKKKAAEIPPPVADTNLWPDVIQAAKTEDKRPKHEKKESESSLPEDAQAGGKKQKWMAIPAAELQEAADKAAESSRRQPKVKRKEDEPKRKKVEPKKAPRMRSGSQGEEARNGFRFEEGVNGSLSAPLSRQGSQQSKQRSPGHSSLPLSPEPGFEGRNGLRGPRGRDREGRGGYAAGRGRGGYRSASNASMASRGAYPELSPLQGNAELYPRFGLGYNYFPVPAGGFVVAPPGYDAAQYAASMQAFPRGMPPPPLPVTQVAVPDPLRYYVLGQVEYYFSMQNLAMDFFLRQQMDSEGWIEVGMIASFNRIKSLTPEVSIVREVMELSSLLEVKDDMVRLAGGEAKRWVLPDANPCKFSGGSPGRNASPRKLAGEGAELSHSVPGCVDPSTNTLGIEDIPKFDVQNALMRNAGSTNPSTSSTASGLEEKTMTPETSVAGDKSDYDSE